MCVSNIFKIVFLYENKPSPNQLVIYSRLCFSMKTSQALISRQITGLSTEINSVLVQIYVAQFCSFFVGAFSSYSDEVFKYFLHKVHSANISVSGKNPFLLIITFRPEVREASSAESLSHKTPRFLSRELPSSNMKHFQQKVRLLCGFHAHIKSNKMYTRVKQRDIIIVRHNFSKT